jgi:cytidylate kinase
LTSNGNDSPWVVTVDGPAGVGKSTIAKRLSEELGCAYLDTGAIYRVVTLAALDAEIPLDDVEGIMSHTGGLEVVVQADGRVFLAGREETVRIRSARVNEAVARVAAEPEVRKFVVEHQRAFAVREGRIVAEGRDMGTVVFPDATVKIYLDADDEVRAQRRLKQEAGGSAGSERQGDLGAVLGSIRERDRLDRTRHVSPLVPAPDAWLLDTTDMTLDEVYQAVRSHVRSRIPIASGGEP